MYALVASGDLSGSTSSPKQSTPKNGSSNRPPKRKSEPINNGKAAEKPVVEPTEFISEGKSINNGQAGRFTGGPSVHLNIEVHISPDLSPEQIEKVFEAMGKHIFRRDS
jgi:hypothetical protein